MTEDPVTIEPTRPVDEAARLIARKRHNRLPVDRARAPRRRGHPRRRARRADQRRRPNGAAGAGPGRRGRDRAQLRAAGRRGGAGRLCAVVKADGYGHGAVPAGARGAGGRRGVAGGGDRRRGRGAARRPAWPGRCSCSARCRARSSPSRWRARRRRRRVARGLRRRAWRASGGRHPACTSSSTRGWAGSAPATPPRPRGWPRPSPPRRRCGWRALMTHFATADEDDPAFLREQLAAFTPWAERRSPAPPAA